MALFDKDNPGKNLTNATIWLESSEDPSGDGDPGGSGCGFRSALVVIAVVFIVCYLFVWCATRAM